MNVDLRFDAYTSDSPVELGDTFQSGVHGDKDDDGVN